MVYKPFEGHSVMEDIGARARDDVDRDAAAGQQPPGSRPGFGRCARPMSLRVGFNVGFMVHVYIYIYIYMYIYIYIYIYLRVYVVYIYMCTHAYMYIYTHVHVPCWDLYGPNQKVNLALEVVAGVTELARVISWLTLRPTHITTAPTPIRFYPISQPAY